MPKAGPLKQILRELSVEELRDLRKTSCSRVKQYNGSKSELVDRMRNSIKRSIDDGETSYGELFSHIKSILQEEGPKHVTTRIRNSIKELEISKNAQHGDTTGVREKWINSELFQILRKNLERTGYNIEQESTFGRSSVDLLIGNESRRYLIEIKLAGNSSSRDKLPSQISKYRKKVPNLRKSFALMVVERERDLPQNKSSVKHIIDETEAVHNTEVFTKKPSEFR